MTVPTFFAKGTAASDDNSAFAVPLPAGTLTDKFLLLVIETNGGGAEADPDNPTAPQALSVDPGYTLLGSNVSQATGLADQTRLTVYWKKGTSSETQPTVAAPGAANHGLAFIVAYSGVDFNNGPIHKTAWGNTSTNDTTVNQIQAVTTTFIDCLIVNVTSAGDNSTFSSPTNATLSGVTIDGQDLTTAGTDGAVAVISGGLATPGGSGATTATISTTEEEANLTFGLAGPQPLNPLAATVAAQGAVSNYQFRWSGRTLRSTRGPFLTGPQQNTKLVRFDADVQFRVDFSPEAGPLQEPVWFSMSTDVRAFSIDYGRSNETDVAGPASMTVRLDDQRGNWETWTTDARFYGFLSPTPPITSPPLSSPRQDDGTLLKPVKQIRVEAVYNGSTYPLFQGLIDDIRTRYEEKQLFVETEIGASDYMAQIALPRVSSTFAEQSITDRIDAYLDAAGWINSTQWRNLTTSTSTGRKVFASETSQGSILDLIRQTAASDGGMFFLDKAGRASYHAEVLSTAPSQSGEHPLRDVKLALGRDNRDWILGYQTTGTTGEVRYTDLALSYSDEQIWTEAVVTDVDGDSSVYSQSRFVDRTGTRTLQVNETLSPSARRIRVATILGFGFGRPAREWNVGVLPQGSTYWNQVFTAEQDDYVLLHRPSLVGGTESATTEDLFLQRISHDVDVDSRQWRLRLQLNNREYP